MNNRILYSDNGTLSDFSVNLNRYSAGTSTFSFVAGEDAIYVGARSPFNHFFVKMGATVNAVNTSMSVSYWDGDAWVPSVEVIDETSAFSQSGFVTFVPNKQKAWVAESTNDQGETVTGLSSVVIYDHYWVKITFAATLTASVVLAWIGQIFCEDPDMAAEFPDLDRQAVRNTFSVGKTDWEEQRARASEIVVQDLIKKQIIWNRGQVLEREQFKLACVYKLAEIIFGARGDDYVDQKKDARNEYKSRLDSSIFKVDKDENGRLDPHEERSRSGFLSR